VACGEDHGYNFSMMKGVVEVNDEQRARMIDKVAKAVGRHHSNLSGVTVGAMGLTFKAGTDDLRESPAMAIIAELRRAGAHVRAFDPTTCGELSPHQEIALAGIELTSVLIEVADGADVICVFTEWPEFADVDLDNVAQRAGAGTTMVDMRNLFDPAAVKNAGLGYDGVGRR
jgi:UDPglucose 6-dehydrogenase